MGGLFGHLFKEYVMPKAGEVAWVMFPYEGAKADKLHPALVLDVLEDGRCIVAYGSSKHVDVSYPLANEVIVSKPDDLVACGLSAPTRFDISKRAAMAIGNNAVIGVLPQPLHKQLYRAAVHCRLI